MKGFRGTLVFAVFVAAVVGLSFWQYKRSRHQAKEKTVNSKLFRALKSNDVVEFEMTSSKSAYKIKKIKSKWHVVAPFSDLANGNAVQSALSSIFSQPFVIAEKGKTGVDWSKFGLVTPEYTFKFRFADGKTQALKIGRVRTYDDGYYLRRNDEPALLVGYSGWDTVLEKKADDFRFMKPELPSGDLHFVKIRSLQQGKRFDFAIVEKKGEWLDPNRPEVRLSTNKVNVWINAIRAIDADTVASDTKKPGDLQKFDLIHPQIELDLANENPPKILHEIAISAPKNSEVHWFTSDNPAVYEMDSGNTKAILKGLDDLRDLKYVFAFNQVQAAHLIYKRVTDAASGHKGAKPVKPVYIALDKVNGNWQLHTPDSKMQVNQIGVRDFIAYLRGLRASKFLNYSVPEALRENEVIIKNKSGKVIYRLQFGGSVTDKLNKNTKIEYYACKSSASPEYFAVTKATLDDLVNKNMVERLPEFLTPKKTKISKKVKTSPPGHVSKTAIGRVRETKIVEGRK